jgi:chromosome segregation ATPase
MYELLSETEKWRTARVGELNSKILDVAGRRADVLYPYRFAGPGTILPEDVQQQLDELDRESQRIEQEIRAVDAEAARREREPIDPSPVLSQLSEELANERHRRRWFAHAVHIRRMEGYRQELENITRRVHELEDEIENIRLAEAFERELAEKAGGDAPS